MMARWFTVKPHGTFCGDIKGLDLLQTERKFIVPIQLVFFNPGHIQHNPSVTDTQTVSYMYV